MAATSESGDDFISAINVTPLVDIFLVLLIIFMVTANLFLEQERKLREIPLTLPAAASGAPREPKAALVSVLVDRAGAVYLDGAPSDLAAVGRRLDARTPGTPPPDVVLSADKDLPYGRVARVIDYVKLHGIANFALNVEEQTLWAGAAR
jgi:biopolymer transport protein ExbD